LPEPEKPREARLFRAASRDVKNEPKQFVRLAEGPVSSEPVSGLNSLFCREKTGNFADLGPISLDATSQTQAIGALRMQIPYTP
jgi:hypothetical protein